MRSLWISALVIAACSDPEPQDRRERGRLGEEAVAPAPRKPAKRDRGDIDIYVDAILRRAREAFAREVTSPPAEQLDDLTRSTLPRRSR